MIKLERHFGLKKWLILLGILLAAIVVLGTALYMRYQPIYTPVPTITSLPNEGQLIIFTGSRKVSPSKPLENGLFVIDADTGDIWQWISFDMFTVLDGFSGWSPQPQLLTLYGSVNGTVEFKVYALLPDGTLSKTEYVPPILDRHSWSPDGTQVAFRYREDLTNHNNYEIYLRNARGLGLRRLTDLPASSEDTPSWSERGIVFSSYDSRSHTSMLYKIDVEGTNLVALAAQIGGSNHMPKWSPDGSRIAFIHDGGFREPNALWVMNPDGTIVESVFTPKRKHPAGGVEAFAWSPDGNRLVFSSGHQGRCGRNWLGSVDSYYCSKHIYIVDTDGSNLRRLTQYAQPRYFDFAWIR